ncbi:helix-turn-helix domain-containing protein [Pelagibacterium halotolerans]|uniref:AraC family transcriptional regulator n=1 Tax=Pelagibacterium halotolerans TaxID=531813 RepID=UPI00384DEFF8
MLSDLIAHGHGMRQLSTGKSDVGLFCMAGGAGYELRVNEIYSWDGLRRGDTPFALIQHTIAGEGRLDYAGANHRLGPGETMLLTFPHANRYWLEYGKSWEYFWIILVGREALRVAGAVLSARGPVLTPAQAAVDRMAESCLRLLARPDATPGEMSAAAYGAVMALYDEAFSAPAPVNAPPPRIERAVRFVHTHLSGQLDVDSLARLAGLSRAHFVRQFTAAMGAPPSDYVFAARVARAERMLLATDATVNEIAKACGFANANYFAKAFRRVHDTSPSEFRQSQRRDGTS